MPINDDMYGFEFISLKNSMSLNQIEEKQNQTFIVLVPLFVYNNNSYQYVQKLDIIQQTLNQQTVRSQTGLKYFFQVYISLDEQVEYINIQFPIFTEILSLCNSALAFLMLFGVFGSNNDKISSNQNKSNQNKSYQTQKEETDLKEEENLSPIQIPYFLTKSGDQNLNQVFQLKITNLEKIIDPVLENSDQILTNNLDKNNYQLDLNNQQILTSSNTLNSPKKSIEAPKNNKKMK
ncbi:hypothetical protein ABPG74_019426 [Tetrahymena malaccensis]